MADPLKHVTAVGESVMFRPYWSRRDPSGPWADVRGEKGSCRWCFSRAMLPGLFLRILVVGLAVWAGACATAGHLEGGEFVVPGRLAFSLPETGMWREVTNRRRGDRVRVVFKRRGGGAWISVWAMPEPEETRGVPLDVLAARTFQAGVVGASGVATMDEMHRIVLDDRTCIAILGRRTERPESWRQALVQLRSQGYLMTLTFVARESQFGELEASFGQVLETFKVLLPGPFDPLVIDDVPVGPPGPAPRNIYAPTPPPPPPLIRSPGEDLDY